MPYIHRNTNISPHIYGVQFSIDGNNQPYFTNAQLNANFQFIAACINGQNDTPISLTYKWNYALTNTPGVIKSNYDWIINQIYDYFFKEVSNNTRDITANFKFINQQMGEKNKLLMGRVAGATPEFLEMFIWHNVENRAVNVGLLTAMMETEKYLWEFLYGFQGITGTHFQEMINWINPTGRMETFGVIPLLIETMKVQWDLLTELGKIDVKDIKDDVNTIWNDIYVSSLFTIPGDENRISGLERELTRNQGRRLEHIDDLIHAITSELGGYKIDEYRFVDSRLAQLESGAKGVWDEDRIVIIEEKAEQNRVDIENIDWETYKPELDDWIEWKDKIITGIKTEIPSMKFNISNITTQLSDLKFGKIPTIERSLATLKTQVDNLKIPNIDDLVTRVSTLETWKNALIIPNITPLETRIQKLETWKNTLEIPDLTTIQTEIETIKQSIVDLKIPDITELETWKTEITEWKDKLEIPDITETLEKLENIKTRIADLELIDYIGLFQRVGELEVGVKAIPISNVSGLTERLESLRLDIDGIEVPDIVPLENLISSVLGIISGIIAPDISGLRIQVAAIEKIVAGIIIPDIEPLKVKISALETKVNVELFDKILAFESQLETLKSDNDKVLDLIIMLVENPSFLLPSIAGNGIGSVDKRKQIYQWIITRGLQ